MIYLNKGVNLEIHHQIDFLLAVPFVNIRIIAKVVVLVVIQVFKSEAEIADKFDGNSGFEDADDIVPGRPDIRVKPVQVIDRRHLSPVRNIQSALILGFASAGIIIIPARDPALHNINIRRIAGAERDDPEMECGLKIRILGQLPLRDDSSTEAQSGEFEDPAVPVVIMLKCPDQDVPIPGMNGLAEQKTIPGEIVQIFLIHIFSIAEIYPELEEIKRLPGPDLKRIPIIQMNP